LKMGRLFTVKNYLLLGGALLMLSGISYAGLELSSTTRFCQSCHIMEYAHLAWSEADHSEHVESCADCHLPKQFGKKVQYKVSSGTHDVYQNLVGVSGKIEIKEESKRIVLENCKDCHAKFLKSGEHEGGTAPKECMKCHKNTAHKRSIIQKY